MTENFSKKFGRFLPKDDPLLEHISIKKFSFNEICTTPIVKFDNSNRNLILSDLHKQQTMETVVNKKSPIEKNFEASEDQLPILQPLDFTHDWKRQQERASRRSMLRIDDDEEFELELEYQLQKKEEHAQKGASTQKQLTKEKMQKIKEEVSVVKQDIDEQSIEKENDGLSKVGDAINNLSKTLDIDEDTQETPFKVKPLDPNKDNDSVEKSEEPKEKFIEIPLNNQSFSDQEKEAANEYKEQVISEDIEEIKNKAKQEGYQDGFKLGEEKAALQTKEENQQLVKNLHYLVSELEKLKRNILSNSEQNFIELNQAIAETLIGKEFEVNPKALLEVIRKAIKESVKDDKIKIFIHPDYYEKIKSLDIKDIEKYLVKDENIKQGNFKIDSNLSVLDGNFKQLIKNIIDEMDPKLFDIPIDKAS